MNATLKKILQTGTIGLNDAEIRKRVIIVNRLSLVLGILIFFIGATLYYLSKRLSILLPATLEFLLAITPLFLNRGRKYKAAALVTFLTQCLSAAYFGMLLRPYMQLEMVVFFLISIIYLLFGKDEVKLRRLALTAAILVLILLRINAYYSLMAPIDLPWNIGIVFDGLCMLGILILIIVVSVPYVQSNDVNPDLKKASELKTSFIYQVTHEMRSPLNAVHSIAQLLKRQMKKNPDPETQPLSDKLLAASSNAKDIVNNVLDIAQIESGQLEMLKPEGVLIHTLLANIVEVNMPLAMGRGIELFLAIDRMPDVIVIDKLAIGQITTNLLANAIKYAYGKTTIFLRVKRSVDNIDVWTLEVINEGQGISREKQAVIFDPFVTDKRDVRIEGTGLGLYIVKKKVELLGGTIEVESQQGGWTKFTATFPLKEGWLGDIRQEEEPDEEIDISGTRILIAEDEPLNAGMLRTFLETKGCVVAMVSDGYGVLEEIEKAKEPFEMIILDYHMPGLDGMQTLKRLKTSEHTNSIPVIIATGDAFKEPQALLLREGADSVIEKPIVYSMLLKALKRHLPEHA